MNALSYGELPSREVRLNHQVPPDECPTTSCDATYVREVRSFYDQIVYLDLEKLKPKAVVISGRTFGMMSFAWQLPWGFSISCANNGAPNVEVINKLVGGLELITCAMTFSGTTIELDCSLKAMRFDEHMISLSFVGVGVISKAL